MLWLNQVFYDFFDYGKALMGDSQSDTEAGQCVGCRGIDYGINQNCGTPMRRNVIASRSRRLLA